MNKDYVLVFLKSNHRCDDYNPDIRTVLFFSRAIEIFFIIL